MLIRLLCIMIRMKDIGFGMNESGEKQVDEYEDVYEAMDLGFYGS